MVACLGETSVAQTIPPDQEFQRQQERERALRRQQEQQPDVRLPRNDVTSPSDRIPDKETPCFTITRIVLRGDQAEKFSYVLKAVTSGKDRILGRCLGVTGINVVMARVQNELVQHGYVTTRVLAPPQDLTTGQLVLTLVPGHVRTISFASDASVRGTKWNAIPIHPGDILNLRDIEQGLENFKRVPTAEADIKIVPTTGDDAQPGDSDLVIQYQQGFPFRLALSLDDSGTKATGKYQAGVTVSYDNWWTLNDLFYVSFNHDLGGGQSGARGTSGYTVHYSVPFGYWTLGFTSSSSDYHQTVAGLNQSYMYSGKSDTGDIKLSRLIYRDAVRKTTLSIKAFQKSSSNFVDDTEVEVQRRRTGGWELGLAHREFVGETTFDLNLAYRRGTGAFSSLEAPEDAFGEGTSRYKIATADVNLAVPFNLSLPWGKQSLRYNLSGRGQWNGTRLTAQERFSIGGRYTVRGFDGEMTLLSERGWFVRNDVGVALGSSGQEAYLGADYGEVAGPSAALLVGTRLAGAVIGLRGNIKNVSYDVFAGAPISKPQGLQTSRLTAGFTLNWSY
ncbi:ShlB/FhaC/HecB family hemolysin secretion/activation protein [Herbaspirillum sp. NPDC101397]|uniref:ShlB/FhaC/HecB family hemolysin secretion/activation protein n=1 Tax=Herbaspirillum sp. NPDC101397 TaxID=3364006 RepID=UPI003839EC4D